MTFRLSLQYQSTNEIYTNFRAELEFSYDPAKLDKHLPCPSRLEHILKSFRSKMTIKFPEINMTESLTQYTWQEWMNFESQVRCMWVFDTHIIFGHEKTFQTIASSDYRRLSAGKNTHNLIES